MNGVTGSEFKETKTSKDSDYRNIPDYDTIDNPIEIQKTIENLKLEKSNLARSSKYKEAEELKQRINHLKSRNKEIIKDSLELKKCKDEKDLELAYQRELKQQESALDKKLSDFHTKAGKCLENLLNKHKTELENLLHSLNLKLPKIPHYPKKYYELRKREEMLVKQESYQEAEALNVECLEIERMHKQKLENESIDRIKHHTDRLKSRHLAEKRNLEVKNQTELKLLRKEHKDSIAVIYHKYKNKRKEMENIHGILTCTVKNPNLFKRNQLSNFIREDSHKLCKKSVELNHTKSLSNFRIRRYNSNIRYDSKANKSYNRRNHEKVLSYPEVLMTRDNLITEEFNEEDYKDFDKIHEKEYKVNKFQKKSNEKEILLTNENRLEEVIETEPRENGEA